jgi:hypothetical protein
MRIHTHWTVGLDQLGPVRGDGPVRPVYRTRPMTLRDKQEISLRHRKRPITLASIVSLKKLLED